MTIADDAELGDITIKAVELGEMNSDVVEASAPAVASAAAEASMAAVASAVAEASAAAVAAPAVASVEKGVSGSPFSFA